MKCVWGLLAAEEFVRKSICSAVGTLLLAACATEPPGPTAEPGTALWEQQKYLQTLEECQITHRWDPYPDAGIGAAPTAEDAKFSECLAPANRELGLVASQSQGADAGHSN
jgi:hypothetical protein